MALDVASSLLMWDVECAMRVDRKKKKKNATSRICDKGWLETRLETLFSTLRNFVKKVRSFFFYSPSPKVIRISLSENRSSKYFFVSNFVKDRTIERSVQIFQSIRRLNDWRNCFTQENLWKRENDRTKFDFIAMESGVVIMLGSCETWAR